MISHNDAIHCDIMIQYPDILNLLQWDDVVNISYRVQLVNL